MKIKVLEVTPVGTRPAHEMAGPNLKLKLRAAKPKGTNKSSPSGNSGVSTKNKVYARGLRKKVKPGRKRYT